MSLIQVTYLDLLHELCLQRGYALLLTAQHTPGGFAEPSRTVLEALDVVHPDRRRSARTGRRLRVGELIISCPLDPVDGDLQAAAELLVGLLATAQQRRAA